jgi:hypothetical protein
LKIETEYDIRLDVKETGHVGLTGTPRYDPTMGFCYCAVELYAFNETELVTMLDG